MTKQDIAIVIPVYKSSMHANEKISLQRCIEVLADYTIILAFPEGLDLHSYLAVYPGFKVCKFKAHHFKDIASYNKLMMSSAFYKQFLAFEYILIYQLDAYVFRDELLEWCNRGFDYIGAPWLEPPKINKKRVIVNLSNIMHNQVGNGGFSLRRVRSHWKMCILLKPLILLFPKNEDFWWGYFVGKLNPFFKKPTVAEAIPFAFEIAPRKAFLRNNNQLPFGCHAWEKYEPDFWQEFIR